LFLVITIYYKLIENDNQTIISLIKIEPSFVEKYFSKGEKLTLVSEIYIVSSILAFIITTVYSILKYLEKNKKNFYPEKPILKIIPENNLQKELLQEHI
jgi:hypothetical protein